MLFLVFAFWICFCCLTTFVLMIFADPLSLGTLLVVFLLSVVVDLRSRYSSPTRLSFHIISLSFYFKLIFYSFLFIASDAFVCLYTLSSSVVPLLLDFVSPFLLLLFVALLSSNDPATFYISTLSLHPALLLPLLLTLVA